MMKNKIILITISSIFIGCNYNLKRKEINDYKKNIKGKWYLNQWTYYHTLEIENNQIFVDNHIDSVFYLNYKLSNDTLITWTENSNKYNKVKIIELAKDTLIIENFLNNKNILNYSKIEQITRNEQ